MLSGKFTKFFTMAAIMVQASISLGLEILDSNYALEEYAVYNASSYAAKLTFDTTGNLYISHGDAGVVMKVSTDREVSTFATNLGRVRDLTWTTGDEYGNNLYVVANGDNFTSPIYKIDADGNSTIWSNLSSPYHQATTIAYDETGLYGSSLYFATSGMDYIYSINESGVPTRFGSWPGLSNGGGVYTLAFDTYGNFGNTMFVGNAFNSESSTISGVFTVDQSGNVTRFADVPVTANGIEIDPTGAMFDGDMFVFGREDFGINHSVWRIDSNGNSTKFIDTGKLFAFSPEGEMYLSDTVGDEVHIWKVVAVPEPGITCLMAFGSLAIIRKVKHKNI